MTFSKFSEFSESLQNPKVVWLPKVLSIWQQMHYQWEKYRVYFHYYLWNLYTPDALALTTLNRHQLTDSIGKFFFTTTSSNVSAVRYRVSVVTILLLDLVMIRWIRWIQRKSFRENSIGRISFTFLEISNHIEMPARSSVFCHVQKNEVIHEAKFSLKNLLFNTCLLSTVG